MTSRALWRWMSALSRSRAMISSSTGSGRGTGATPANGAHPAAPRAGEDPVLPRIGAGHGRHPGQWIPRRPPAGRTRPVVGVVVVPGVVDLVLPRHGLVRVPAGRGLDLGLAETCV